MQTLKAPSGTRIQRGEVRQFDAVSPQVCDRIPSYDTHALDKSESKVYRDATEASDQLLKISGYRTMSDPLETFSAVGGWNLANMRCSFWFSSGTRSGAIFGN